MPIAAAAIAPQERAALQQLSSAVATTLAPSNWSSLDSSVERAYARVQHENLALIQALNEAIETIAALIQAHADEVAKAKAQEAGKKAAVWSTLKAFVLVVVAIIVLVIACIGSPFAAGTSLALIVAVAALVLQFLAAAAAGGHPLAGEFAGIIAPPFEAIRNCTDERNSDRRAALAKLIAEITQAGKRLEQMPRRAAALKGPCLGDPVAAFDVRDSIWQSANDFASCLRRQQTKYVELPPLVAGLDKLLAALGRTGSVLRPGKS